MLTNTMITIGFLFTFLSISIADPTYSISRAGGVGRRFDGIGGLSGGGCSTRLLADYSNLSYSQIMDYLFLPGFGASLQILKVEIGGDVQSTDGTEPSHMHSADDENYERGYEWKVMVEAKRRNPNIILYGLSWGFPGWVSEGTGHPWTNSTVAYTLKWILGAKKYYNLDIDYIGIWNERGWDKGYTLSLRAALIAAGLKTKIVGHDGTNWDVCDALSKDVEWAAAVDVIGAHYPAAKIQSNCADLNKVQWASEDMAVSWDTGAGCWAREINQNYVRANLTSTIAWDLINAFYDNLEFAGAGLLRAVQPWSNYYQIGQVLWAAAHWGQFTKPGWFFLQHGAGVGLLDGGGSYVALTDSQGEDLTIIIETMKRDNAQCRFSSSDHYNTTDQRAFFKLDDSFAHVTQLYVFLSNFSTTDVNQAFVYEGVIELPNRAFSLNLPVGVFCTLSTINGTKGAYKMESVSTPFPVPYQDDFERYAISSEGAYFADQSGSWEITNTSGQHGKVMRQMVTEKVISWCKETPYPYSVIGDPHWRQSFTVTIDALIEDNGLAFVAVGVARGSCDAGGIGSPAIVFSISTTNNGQWQLTASTNLTNPVSFGNTSVLAGTWYTITLTVLDDHSEAYINGNLIGRCELNVSTSSGWIAIGSSWSHVQFDNFHLQSPK